MCSGGPASHCRDPEKSTATGRGTTLSTTRPAAAETPSESRWLSSLAAQRPGVSKPDPRLRSPSSPLGLDRALRSAPLDQRGESRWLRSLAAQLRRAEGSPSGGDISLLGSSRRLARDDGQGRPEPAGPRSLSPRLKSRAPSTLCFRPLARGVRAPDRATLQRLPRPRPAIALDRRLP